MVKKSTPPKKRKVAKKKAAKKKPRKKTASKKRVKKQKPVVADEDKPLTPKQKVFKDEYLLDLNGTQAAIRAGYSKRSAKEIASELLTKPNIKKAIQAAAENRSKKTGLNAEWVLERLEIVTDRCMQVTPVMEFDHNLKEMVETGEFKFEHTGANKSLELIGRHFKMFTDKKEISAPGGGPVQVISTEMSAKEATALYKSIVND